MAIVSAVPNCLLGPPPLPPGKRFLCKTTTTTNGASVASGSGAARKNQASMQSSTYLSFRDPAVESWIPMGIVVAYPREVINKPPINNKKLGKTERAPNGGLIKTASTSQSRGKNRASNTWRTNGSLSRDLEVSDCDEIDGARVIETNLFRSHSEGNLHTLRNNRNRRRANNDPVFSTPLDKCIKRIYGSWKNLLQLGGMSRPSKAVTQVKKVAPPAVPDVFRHSGSSFGSAGYASSEDGGFLSSGGGSAIGAGSAGDDGSYGMPSGKSPGPIFTHPGFAFPPVVGKYAHAEDQGIDMTQSPGRDSPGSSGSGSGSRHSTASLDSGRASGYHLGGPRGPGALASSPRCSISSLGSHPDRPADLDVVHAWLTELQFDEYFPLFASAGYDLATITRMTPEDLTAIGIKKPNHRKRLKAEIDNLNVGDGLPEHVPGSLEEWLRLLRLEEYLGALHQQGMRSVEDVTTLTWEDLEDIGIVRLGHQKKLLLAIKRVKDIRAGKRIQPLDLARLPPHPGHTQDVVIQRGGPDLPSPDEDCSSPVLRSFQRVGNEATSTWRSMYAALPGGLEYSTINRGSAGSRGKSLESLEDAPLVYPPSPAPTSHADPIGWRPRCFEDGDLTPTNEAATSVDAGGGTLPRPRHCLVRPRPVAKVTATPGQFKSLPRDFDNKYQLTYGLESSPHLSKRRPPSPPRRQSSRELVAPGANVNPSGDVVIDCSGPVPTATCDDHHIHHHLHHPPPPAPAPAMPSTPQMNRPPSSTMSRSWGSVSVNVNEEHELIATLALQHRNGSDASFKSSSSTESDSLPFANENAGTIKQRAARVQEYAGSPGGLGSHVMGGHHMGGGHNNVNNGNNNGEGGGGEPADVLNDIGNMLANLTDELDAMLEEEKRQGLNS
ncbi:caskin-1 isoform X2 [Venturia canescens]|uniref:caskin-1 isoform X2 n=1 Tax=Venturia canescens TaxID=32260 RepID=UPI001C9C13D8|nr:caskin-1 isoform X2 [Venturia canescens]